MVLGTKSKISLLFSFLAALCLLMYGISGQTVEELGPDKCQDGKDDRTAEGILFEMRLDIDKPTVF